MEFWKKSALEVNSGNKIAILYVLESKGSSPGRQGFKMMVSESGMLFGSVGGGLMEFDLVELAKQHLKAGKTNPIKKRLVHRKNQDDASGLICSGEQTVAIYVLSQQDKNLLASLAKGKGVLVLKTEKMYFEEGELLQKMNISIDTETWSVKEDLSFYPQLHIIGGGHVSLALSKFAVGLGFLVTVYDDRKDLNTLQGNTFAKTIYVADYKDIASFVPQGKKHYVVIMSFKYDLDLLILSELLSQKYNYLGLMGSKQKIKKLFMEMARQGFRKEQLDFVHSPIGLQINSQTPSEIAISILGEIIKVKNS